MDGVGHADLQSGALAMARLFEGAHTLGTEAGTIGP
jgi:hypothetical protein